MLARENGPGRQPGARLRLVLLRDRRPRHGAGHAGFLGARYAADGTDHEHDPREHPASSTASATWTISSAADLRDLLEQAVRARADSRARSASHNEAYQRVRGLMASEKLFDITQEPQKMRDQYGPTQFGEQALVARRLVEAGVPFVRVGRAWWDSHGQNFETHQEMVPELDHVMATLIDDLKERGLLENTLIVTLAEFGRTPGINASLGRDHFAIGLEHDATGCGIKGGAVYGKTDATGNRVVEGEVGAGELFATIYRALGINPHKNYYVGSRPIPLIEPRHQGGQGSSGMSCKPTGSMLTGDLPEPNKHHGRNPDKLKLVKDSLQQGHPVRHRSRCRTAPGSFSAAPTSRSTTSISPTPSSEPKEIGSHASYVTGVALAGKSLVSGGYDGKLIWWDTEKRDADPRRRCPREVDSQGRRLRPDGKIVASVADDMVCKVWDADDAASCSTNCAATRRRRRTTSPRCSMPVAFSPDGKNLATGDKVGHIVVWDVTTGKELDDAGSAGHVHLGPGAAHALDRRHPLAGLLARRQSAGGRRHGQDRQHRPPRRQGPRRGVRLAEGQADARVRRRQVQGDGRTTGVPSARATGWLAAGGAGDGFLFFMDLKKNKVIRQEERSRCTSTPSP